MKVDQTSLTTSLEILIGIILKNSKVNDVIEANNLPKDIKYVNTMPYCHIKQKAWWRLSLPQDSTDGYLGLLWLGARFLHSLLCTLFS